MRDFPNVSHIFMRDFSLFYNIFMRDFGLYDQRCHVRPLQYWSCHGLHFRLVVWRIFVWLFGAFPFGYLAHLEGRVCAKDCPYYPAWKLFLSNFITIYRLSPPIINTCMRFHFILNFIRKSREEIITRYPFHLIHRIDVLITFFFFPSLCDRPPSLVTLVCRILDDVVLVLVLRAYDHYDDK